MSETKPSAGALKAAKAIDEFCITADLNDDLTIIGIAEIIDRESSRPQVEELVRMIKKSAEVAASKQNRQEAAAVVLDLVLPHLADKAREVEAALGGKAE